MIPDIETQLKVAIKSLKDNVAPAVDSNNRVAQEQMHLSVATLEMVLNHLPLAHQYVRRDIQQHNAMAENIKAVCGRETDRQQLQQAVVQAAAALDNPELGMTQLLGRARQLRETIGHVITDKANEGNAEAIERAVLKSTAATLTMARAWTKPMGFEPDPDAVTNLNELLG